MPTKAGGRQNGWHAKRLKKTEKFIRQMGLRHLPDRVNCPEAIYSPR